MNALAAYVSALCSVRDIERNTGLPRTSMLELHPYNLQHLQEKATDIQM